MDNVDFWNLNANPEFTRYCFVDDYFNVVLHHVLGNLVWRGRVLKTDLMNESFAKERDVLSLFGESIGLDISKVVCKRAHIVSKQINIAQGDIRCIPFRSGEFGLLLDLSTIDHVSECDAVKVIGEYSRLLKPGGVLVLLFAQSQPFAMSYWSGMFNGVYLLNDKLVVAVVQKYFGVSLDCGVDFLHSVMGVPPFRWFERLICHVPRLAQNMLMRVLFQFERSIISILVKRFCGMRLLVGVKK